jgi:hypothetical protein
MDKFIHRKNLALFSKRLADPTLTDAQRNVILRLRTEEQSKDRRTTPPTQVPASGPMILLNVAANNRAKLKAPPCQAARVSELLWLANGHEA